MSIMVSVSMTVYHSIHDYLLWLASPWLFSDSMDDEKTVLLYKYGNVCAIATCCRAVTTVIIKDLPLCCIAHDAC